MLKDEPPCIDTNQQPAKNELIAVLAAAGVTSEDSSNSSGYDPDYFWD